MKNKTLLYICCFTTFFFACKNLGSEQLILPKSTLTNVLADVHLAESAASRLEGFKKDSVTRVYYQQIYQIHNIQEVDLKHDLDVLKNDNETMSKIYKNVIDTLNKRQKEVGLQ
jgi:hypothetical protein